MTTVYDDPKLLRNAMQCLICMDIVESKFRHDFQRCTCGMTFVDGGLEYCRYGYRDHDSVKDLCLYEQQSVSIPDDLD